MVIRTQLAKTSVLALRSFLLYFFGSKAKTTPIEIEIPKILASLEYPFPVKKSDLVSFTNGRALGSVLGMLEWIVDSLTYGSDMDPIRTFYPNFEGEIDCKHEIISLCLNSDADVDSEQVYNHLNDLIVKTCGTEDDFELMIEEQEKLEQELQRLEDQIQQIRELPQTIQTYESDIKNYDNYSQEMRAHMKTNEEILLTLENEKSEKFATIKKIEEQKKQVKCQVEEQMFGHEEAIMARERKQQLEDEIKQEFEIIDDIRKSIRLSRLDCSKYEDTIRKMESDLDSFVNAMSDLVDSPVMTNYSSKLRELVAKEQWLEILASIGSIKTNGQTNGTNINELEKLFSHRVHSLKIAIVQHLSSLKGSVSLTELQKLNECNLLVEEKEKQLALSVKQVEQLVSQTETHRKEQVSQITALQSECDRTRQLLNELDGNTKRSHKEVKHNLLELRKQVEERETVCESEQKAMTKELETIFANNRKGLQEFSSNLDSFIAEQQTNTTQLKAVLAKTGSTAGAAKERKGREKRDKKDSNNKENK